MFEIGGTFLWGELAQGARDLVPQLCSSARCGLAQGRFELGEDLFDWVEIGAIGRQIEQICALGFDGLSDARDLVGGQIVHDDDISGLESGGEELLGPDPEGLAVHGAIKRQGCGDAVVAKCCEEGGGAPVTVRGFRQQSLADRTAPAAAHHVGGEAGFVDEDEAVDIEDWLLLNPVFPSGLDVRPVLLGCVKGFF